MWAKYGIKLFLASVLSFIKLFFVAKFISIEEFGIYATIMTTYGLIVVMISLGGLEGVMVTLADGNSEVVNRASSVMSSIISTLLIFSSIAVIIFLAVFYSQSEEMVLLVSSTLILIFISIIFNYIEVVLRANQRFREFSNLILFRAVLTLAVVYASSNGARVAELILLDAVILIAAVVLSTKPLPIRLAGLSFSVKQSIALMSVGFPILISNLIKKLSFSVDRWIIMIGAGALVLGQYSFVMMIHLGFVAVGGIVNTAFGPLLLRKISIQRIDIWEIIGLKKLLIVLCCLIILILVITFKVGDVLIQEFYPIYYKDGIVFALSMTALGSFFVFLQGLIEWFFIAYGKSSTLVIVNLIGLISLLLVFLVILIFEGGLVYYSIAFCVVRLISFSMLSLKLYGRKIGL